MILEQRLEKLALPAHDCVPLKEQELGNILSKANLFLTKIDNYSADNAFSIGEIPPETVRINLESLGIHENEIHVCWPALGEALRIKWDLFVRYYDDLWHPSSDDIVVISLAHSWCLVISHEETVSYYRNLSSFFSSAGDQPPSGSRAKS